MHMSVQVQQTPNPNARKFILPNRRFERSMNFPDAEAARNHPLATKLFKVEGVYNVFFAQDFVTVNKVPAVNWDVIEPTILSILSEELNGH